MSEVARAPLGVGPGRAEISRPGRNRLNALEALERGFTLFQSTFATEAWRYYAGAAPLVICFIFIWVIDGQIRVSNTAVFGEATGLAAAYALRAWAVAGYMHRVRQCAFGGPESQLDGGLRQVAAFGRLLTWKIILSLAALATLITVAGAPWFYSAAQFASLGAQEQFTERHSMLGCLGLAGEWFSGSFLLFAMSFPVWGAVWLNGFILAAALPGLLHSIFGLNTLLSTEAGIESLFESWAFWLALFSAVWLALDPIIKCTFIVVYQHLRSRREGDDLRGLLASLPHDEQRKAEQLGLGRSRHVAAARSGLILLILILGALSSVKAEVPQSAAARSAQAEGDGSSAARIAELRSALDQESERAAYRWHDAEHRSPPGWFGRLMNKVGDAIGLGWKRLVDFVRAFLPKDFALTPGKSIGSGWRLKDFRLWIGLIFALTLAAGAFLIWRRRQSAAAALSVAVSSAPLPDLSEAALATEHSEQDWFRLANRLENEGQLRLALRAAYLGLLAGLSQREWLTIRRDRTNREYLDEFTRRWRRRPQAAVEMQAAIPAKLRGSLRVFDRVWYGSDSLTAAQVAAYRQAQQELLDHV